MIRWRADCRRRRATARCPDDPRGSWDTCTTTTCPTPGNTHCTYWCTVHHRYTQYTPGYTHSHTQCWDTCMTTTCPTPSNTHCTYWHMVHHRYTPGYTHSHSVETLVRRQRVPHLATHTVPTDTRYTQYTPGYIHSHTQCWYTCMTLTCLFHTYTW